MQKIIDFAYEKKDLDLDVRTRLINYARAHKKIAIKNMVRKARGVIGEMMMTGELAPPGEPEDGASTAQNPDSSTRVSQVEPGVGEDMPAPGTGTNSVPASVTR